MDNKFNEKNKEMLPIASKRKRKQTKFQFKKRGRLEEREMEELRKTNTSMESWLVSKATKTEQVELEDMDWEDRDREEKLARVEMKKMAWVSTKLCRSVVMEVVNNAVKRVDNQHLSRIVADMMDEA